LYAGLADLPSAAAAYALAALGPAPDAAARAAFLADYGHRGPGEAEPEAQRWADHPDRLLACAALPAARDAAHGQTVRTDAEHAFQARLGGRWQQLAPALAQARALCRATDLAWDCFVRVMSAAQSWLRAVAVEARAAGLIAEVTEVSYLELEELKQVATGEWHGGRSAAVRGEVARRRAERANARAEPPQPPQPASPGQAAGPLFRSDGAQDGILRYAQAIVLVDVADPGQAPCWLAVAGLLDAAGDPWSPGMIAARALAVPAISGLPPDLWQAASGQMVEMDAGAGRVARAMKVDR
jgi:pyruvate,water dikinase